MARATQPQVVTANALISGRVVWMTASGGWEPCLRAAALFTCSDAAAAALARAAAQPDRVVGPYLAEMQPAPDGPRPAHFREAFRRDGPSPAARIPG